MADELTLGQQLNGVPPEAMVPPPKSPEEMEQRKGQWGQFLDQVKNDPNVQMAILRMGTNLMQPVAPGQTSTGHLGASLANSVDYLASLREAERHSVNEDRKLKIDEATGAANVEGKKAQTAQTRQSTAQEAEAFPMELKAKKLKLKELEANEHLWTPEQATLAQNLKMDVLRAEINMKNAHGRMYDSVAGKGDGKTPSSKSMQMDDGTVLTTTSSPKGTFYSRFVPPKFNSVEEAQAAATQQVDKQTPWIFGKPAYQGTREQEVARLTKLWTEPKVEHYDANLQPVKALPTDGPTPGAASSSPADFPRVTPAQQNARDVEAGQIRAGERSPEELQKSVQDLQTELKRKDLTGSARSILKRELEMTQRALNGGEVPGAPAGSTVVKVERGADGKLVIPSSSDPTTREPGLLSRMKTGAEESRIARAQAKLPEIRAKQKAKLPLTAAEQEALTLLGQS